MTMFQNWSTKDEIETSISTFQSVRDEIENTFSKIEWRGDENGRENLYLCKGYYTCRFQNCQVLAIHNIVWWLIML